MSFLTKTYRRLQEKAVQKKLGHLTIQRQPEDYATASSIGLLLKVGLAEEMRPVRSYVQQLEKEGKTVKVLAFVDSKNSNDNFPFKYFDRQALDWLEQPSGKEVDYFIGQPFDMLISLCAEPCIPVEYIAALSRAQLRVGPFIEKPYCYDLMIDAHDKDLAGLIKEIDFYLASLNVKSANRK